MNALGRVARLASALVVVVATTPALPAGIDPEAPAGYSPELKLPPVSETLGAEAAPPAKYDEPLAADCFQVVLQQRDAKDDTQVTYVRSMGDLDRTNVKVLLGVPKPAGAACPAGEHAVEISYQLPAAERRGEQGYAIPAFASKLVAGTRSEVRQDSFSDMYALSAPGKLMDREGYYQLYVTVRLRPLKADGQVDTSKRAKQGKKPVSLTYNPQFRFGWVVHGTWFAGQSSCTSSFKTKDCSAPEIAMIATPLAASARWTPFEKYPWLGVGGELLVFGAGATVTGKSKEARLAAGGFFLYPLQVSIPRTSTEVGIGAGWMVFFEGKPVTVFGLSTLSPVAQTTP